MVRRRVGDYIPCRRAATDPAKLIGPKFSDEGREWSPSANRLELREYSTMDLEKEIHSLAAETLALNIALCNVLHKLLRDNPTLRPAVIDGFNQSADVAADVAIMIGKSASPEHTVKALLIIEEMRGVVLGDDK